MLATYVRGGRLALAPSSECSTYECEYVALARELGVPLVTADADLVKAFPGTAVAPQAFGGRGG